MEDIWAWVLYPYPKEEQVVLHTLEMESNYDMVMPLSHTPVSVEEDDESFEDEEEPIEKDEQHDEEFGGVPADSSPYSDSSSLDDLVKHIETHGVDTTDSEPSLKIIIPLPPSSSRSFSNHASGPMTITTPRKYIPIPSRKTETSSASLPRSSKKRYPSHKSTPQVDKWIR